MYRTLLAFALLQSAAFGASGFLPASRVLLDAHNCYPYDGKWSDRIDRALATGTPLAIEQDIAWNGTRQIVTHGPPFTGNEPTLQTHFFEKIRPIVEAALRDGNRGDWPLITLNLDFKSEEPELLAEIWSVLGEYEPWLTTVERGPMESKMMPLDVKPVLALTGSSDAQARFFFDRVPAGTRLRVFGAAHLDNSRPATNYRRWLNYSWTAVEEGGQKRAGDWTAASDARLRGLVERGHANGYWVRFYTLDGLQDPATGGWDANYNFGSREKVRARWQAAIRAGVDFVATDQYEEFATVLKQPARVLVHGHRGARAMRPENTLPAFEYAIAAGVDALELDMAVTKDNVLVISHDPLLNPAICQAPRPGAPIHAIRELTLAEVREYDCGAKSNPNFPKQMPVPGARMPTLDEVFDLAAQGTFDFNIETKITPQTPQYTPSPEEFARLVLEAIRRHHAETRVILQSFDFRTLHAMKKLAPEIRRSALWEGGNRDFVAIANEAEATIVSPEFHLVTPDKVRAAHAAGLQVVPWTANRPEDWKMLTDAGVDAIISDDPAALIEWLKTNRK